jgi:transposase
MEAIVERACGLDVHQKTIVACALVGSAGERPKKEVKTFGTTLSDLEELSTWLDERGITHIGMESTGVYWKPVYAVLERGDRELIVGNAHHIKNVPGRKTDVKDAEWIADLVRHGLIAKSFVPPKPIRELRDLMRYHRKLVSVRSGERNRLLKLLETANIKLSGVATNVFGKSGMAMLEALANGQTSGEILAELAEGLLKKKKTQLRKALEGRVEAHHRFVLRMQLDRLKAVDADLTRLDAFIEEKMVPYRVQQELLEDIPGVGAYTARAIIAEIGVDMSVFKTEHHLASWAGVCPGNNESAGKRLHGRIRKGNVYLRTAVVEASMSAVRKKGSYLRDKYYRLKSRMGVKRAAVAIAHKILIAAYRMLSDGTLFRDLGEGYLDTVRKARAKDQLVRRLEAMGFQVELKPSVAA